MLPATASTASGGIEVDQIASNGTVTVLYNTASKSTATYALTAASAPDGSGNTTYTGTFSPTIPANSTVTIAGFTNAGNSGTFTVVSCSTTQLVVVNSGGVAETNPGTATLQLTQIVTVGGLVVLSDGSINVADSNATAIYQITNPGSGNIAITTVIGPSASLCCNISGMANPPGSPLYLTLNGSTGTPQVVSVSSTPTVGTVNSTQTYTLTAAGTASDGSTTYTGTFSPTIPAGASVTIAGFTTNALNNGTFTVVSCSSTQLVVNNGNGIAETTRNGRGLYAADIPERRGLVQLRGAPLAQSREGTHTGV